MINDKTELRVKENTQIRIAMSGPSGCGNTTVSTLLAKTLGIDCINYTFRNLAAELNIPFTELLQKARTDFSFDKMLDKKQIELASKKSCVLGSRLAVWLLDSADLRVYLQARIDTRAKRIQTREGGSLEKIKEATDMRDLEDSRRYKELYGIDNRNFAFADLIIDTEKNNPEQIVAIILNELHKRGLVCKKTD